jgi:hypothetical protein
VDLKDVAAWLCPAECHHRGMTLRTVLLQIKLSVY